LLRHGHRRRAHPGSGAKVLLDPSSRRAKQQRPE
jgi:hypothetical protein